MKSCLGIQILCLCVILIIDIAGSELVKTAECGSTLGCFHNCAENGTGCTFLITWLDTKDGQVEFVIKSTVPSLSNNYFAIGFSDDALMKNDSVTECIVEDAEKLQVGVYHSFNAASGPRDNNRLDGQSATAGFTGIKSTYSNGIFVCNFTQEKSVRGVSEIFDLNNDWTLMFATGQMDTSNTGKKLRHKTDHPPSTKETVDFQGTADIRLSTEVAPSVLTAPDACGTTLGCFHDGADSTDTSFVITWKDTEDGSIEFHIYASAAGTSKRWFAVGFSEDRKMGSDSVTECVMEEDGSVAVYQSYNEDDEDDNVRLSAEFQKFGLRFAKTTHQNGIFMCEFYREKTPANASKEIFDLNEDWHMMYATGLMKGDRKKVHSLKPKPSSSEDSIDLQSFDNVMASSKKGKFIKKFHGILMVLAWITCASIGLVIARYYKPMCPKKKLFGTNVWFQVHRLLMSIAVTLTIISFILIFAKEQKWVEIHGSAFVQGHPICGLLVLILAIINPTMSFFRCGPDDDKRKYFNIAHFGVGVSAHILAALTILMGINIDDAHVSKAATYVVVIFVIYQIAFQLFLEFRHKIFKDSGENYEIQKGANTTESEGKLEEESKVQRVTRFALYGHIAMVSLLSVVIVIIIAIP